MEAMETEHAERKNKRMRTGRPKATGEGGAAEGFTGHVKSQELGKKKEKQETNCSHSHSGPSVPVKKRSTLQVAS